MQIMSRQKSIVKALRSIKSHLTVWGLLATSLTAVPSAALADSSGMVSVHSRVLNMRSGPGTQHPTQWQLRRGYPLDVIQRQGKWIKVRDFENDTGWVAKSLIGKTPYHIVKSSKANIRSGPGTRYHIVSKATYGQLLRTLDKHPSWVQVQSEDGTQGWVLRNLLWGW